MKTNKRESLGFHARCAARKLRVSTLLLFLCMATFADDMLIIEAKVNGNSVRLMFDTGSEKSCLFRKSAQRLGISFTEPRQDQAQIRDGRVSAGLTEEFRLSFGDAEQKVRFRLIDVPPYLEMGADGLIAWADATNNIILISADNMRVSILETLPVDIAQWPKWRLRGDTWCPAFEVPTAEGETRYVYIDTGMCDGVELSDKQWKRWRSENPDTPVTMRAYYTPADGFLSSEQCWSRRFSLGDFSVPDTPVSPSAPGLAFTLKDHAAILGLFALTRFDVIIDRQGGYVFMKRKFDVTNEFHYNKIGAVFAPTIVNCDDLVAHVAVETPAYEAGIRNGDLLLKIDGLDVTKWRTEPSVLPLVRFFEGTAGTRLQLVLVRGGEQYTAAVTLKDLFGPSCAPPYDSAASRFLEHRAEAERGDAQAQYLLGVCYEEGSGTSRDVAEAAKWWRKAAEQNFAPAQSKLGVCYVTGDGVAKKDQAEAVKWYSKAAEQGLAEGQYNLGVCYTKGEGVEKNDAEAAKWYRKAAEQGFAAAQYNLGVCIAKGQGVKKSDVEAVAWYRKAAEQGFASAQLNLGVSYRDGVGVGKDEAMAATWCRKAAEQGLPKAQSLLGSFYQLGSGVEKDEAAAARWFYKAAEQGFPGAQYSLGSCYALGWGVKKDVGEAVTWYRKAADQNDSDAQAALGVAYLEGRGVEKNEVLAQNWLRKAAEQGSVIAQSNLGVCYVQGLGVRKDEVEAVRWFREAAEQDFPDALSCMGNCYVQGFGVQQDLAEAVRWYRKAAEQIGVLIQGRFCTLRLKASAVGVMNERSERNRYGRALTQLDLQTLYNLGYCYLTGRGVKKDEAEGVAWLRKAAELGLADAQCDLGCCYLNGMGVKKNESVALGWLRKASDQGFARGQYNLGYCYADGTGVEKDEATAAYWFRKAAERGFAAAQYSLAKCYANGIGLEMDIEEAARLLRKAAAQNDAPAQHALAFFLAGGTGVDRDDQEAYVWYLIALANDASLSRQVPEMRGEIESRLTAGQIAAARKRAELLRTELAEGAKRAEGNRDILGIGSGEVKGETRTSVQPSTPEDPVTAAERSLVTTERYLGSDHPEVAVCLCRLAEAYCGNGQHALAATMYRRALAIREKALGPDHADLAEVLEKLAAVYRKTGAWDKEAEELEKRAAAIKAAR